MSNLIPAAGGLIPITRREDRALVRQLGQLDRSRTMGLARIATQAELLAAKAHAVGYVGQQALHAVAMLSQTESQLGSIVPAAVTRLEGVADIAALSIAEVVAETRRIG